MAQQAATYYVSPQGNDSNPGTQLQPWRTVIYAVKQVKAGDTVLVADGTYQGPVIITRSGEPGAYITLKSINLLGAKIEVANGTGKADGIKAAANYLTIDGFEIYDKAPGNGHLGNGVTVYENHHVNILNNEIHGFGGSGIQAGRFDYVHIENNVVYNNAKYDPNQKSGISLWQARAVDSASGYHIIVRHNRSFGNLNVIPNTQGNTTDGNGILVDDFWNATGDGATNVTFPHRTLIENNLSYDNGGKGIQVFKSSFVDVFNNTAYHNNYDPTNVGTWRAELSHAFADETVWRNNIGVAKPGAGILEWNHAILIGGEGNTVWEHNITYSGTPGDDSVNLSGSSVSEAYINNNNMLGENPDFNNAKKDDFSLQLESPAINAGSDLIVSFVDINYDERPEGAVDIGAFEFDSSDLPVELTSFEAMVSGAEIQLAWTTASELNNAGFDVELRASGRDFERMLFVDGKGTTDIAQQYKARLSDLAPVVYALRLKQIDFDGTYALSDEVVTTIQLGEAYQLTKAYPNPFNPEATFNLTVAQDQEVSIQLYDMLGRQVQSIFQGMISPDTPQTVTFEAENFPNGKYIVRATGELSALSRVVTLIR